MLPTLRVLSLGAGVQSSTLFLMSCREELPRLDAAIFADTQWEPAAVYDHLAWLEDVAHTAGIPLYRVTKGNLQQDVLRGVLGGGRCHGGARWASLPLYTLSAGAAPEGQIRRQCTRDYKLNMIRRQTRELLGIPKGGRVPPDTLVEQWIGISADETRRIRLSRDRWIRHRYPLVFDCQPAMRRQDCLAWLHARYPGHRVPRSACIGCPFHSNAEWRAIRADPTAWQNAVAFDRAIRRQRGLRGEAFLHQSRVPLESADLEDPDPNQGTLWSQECLGMCGV